MKDVLAVDVGTSAFKMGVFDPALSLKAEATRRYTINLYDGVKADIDPQLWWDAFLGCCTDLHSHMHSVGVVSFSVTTPGLVPMSRDGTALGPAILFMDGRSNEQAARIRGLVGEEHFLREACNLPVSGGSSLASIMWIHDNQAEVWKETHKFGHCNTYMVKKLTGRWAIDPSTVSITGMYHTARDDLTWNEHVLSLAEVPVSKLPPLVRSDSSVGTIDPSVAATTGMAEGTAVLCGGNDAVLATLSTGLATPGEMTNVHGTCDITTVCVDRPISSSNFNLRCHVIPGYWLTFFVLNTGGKALEWFHSVFCLDMSEDQFFAHYVPEVLAQFLDNPRGDALERDLPVFVPYLQGSRYSLEPLKAAFSSLTLQTSRDMLLLALIKSNLSYHADHIREIRNLVEVSPDVIVSGGAAKIGGFLRAKKRWTGDYNYRLREQSSLIGAAMLGQSYLASCNAKSASRSRSGDGE